MKKENVHEVVHCSTYNPRFNIKPRISSKCEKATGHDCSSLPKLEFEEYKVLDSLLLNVLDQSFKWRLLQPIMLRLPVLTTYPLGEFKWAV